MNSGRMRSTGRGAASSFGVRRVTVDADEAGRRLDNFLLGRLKGVPRSRVYRLIRSGEVRVNAGRARADQRLAAGDEVRIPPVRVSAREALVRRGQRPALDWLEAHVLYEDEDLLVLDKPAGLAVHGGSGVSLGAIELLRAARPQAAVLELAHRLDRETSGCLLVAKRRSALRKLHEQFRAGDVEKHYIALVLGAWPARVRRVSAPLLTTSRRGGERHVGVDAQGKESVTWFAIARRLPGATLLDVRIDTGRTHQIRVHAAHAGHPVAGDRRYGPADQELAARCDLRRLFLHAGSLEFASPRSGERIRVEAPLPADLQAVLERLASAA